MWAVVVFLVTAIVFFNIGWWIAHKTVASECKKLGKFYVNEDVFECVKITHRER